MAVRRAFETVASWNPPSLNPRPVSVASFCIKTFSRWRPPFISLLFPITRSWMATSEPRSWLCSLPGCQRLFPFAALPHARGHHARGRIGLNEQGPSCAATSRMRGLVRFWILRIETAPSSIGGPTSCESCGVHRLAGLCSGSASGFASPAFTLAPPGRMPPTAIPGLAPKR